MIKLIGGERLEAWNAIMRRQTLLWIVLTMLSSACSDDQAPLATDSLPWVRTFTIEHHGTGAQSLSGSVRARYETPLAFQVAGRIATRHVDAGQHTGVSEVLFQLDPRDLEAALREAEADLASAQAALATAEADLGRARELVTQKFFSQQAVDKAELAEREARARLLAAQSRLQQAHNRRGYAVLRAPAAGVVIEVGGELGQVVAAGQVLGQFAHDGPREVEVFLSDSGPVPASGQLRLPDGQVLPVTLREVAAVAEALSRTRRVRYRVEGEVGNLALGSVVRLHFDGRQDNAHRTFEIPIGALDERGRGAYVWRLYDGKVEPVAVEVIDLKSETAQVRVALPVGSRIVALGAHLLQSGMAVRELE
ncbi:MAG: efflux RND transporter periplasmic adaptor subunit [Gammaproteobacteria bacterium]